MYNSIQDTVIIGKKVIYLPSCHSTNDIAAEIVQAGLFAEGTVIITDQQLVGRGQRGTSWNTNPGENLTFSVIFSPDFLPVSEQFLLSQAIAVAVCSYCKNYCADASVKWPNDILIGQGKVAGILIENSIQGSRIHHAIAGIGLNINQAAFSAGKATSLFLETGSVLNLQEEFVKVCRHLDQCYLALKNPQTVGTIREQYIASLFGFGAKRRFLLEGEMREGEVTGVTSQGKMLVRFTDELQDRAFGLKEIEWVWD
ncbi:biotin--[acetyl-CoA-carboxylase] ligase [Dyadobacter sandarakinus]|uniref:Biotin--[acetyl-CoA-carboxylase] ligase n=1 Tax=Dyadobacter sandarakinus TaxID=2747268 RepID=A0ABX7I6J7_9BACT|nr:biotin--[acetyl-CoA-carboxylase] ligase [Dyadobacter sandarakinus]QRR01729.1 biotin--[acetyl-CoA-carboxylase] ligase [Dyadobacter sandarakinus]